MNHGAAIAILSQLELEDLNTICMTNTTMQNLCHDKEFWTYKFYVDGFVKPSWVGMDLSVYEYRWLKFILGIDYYQ